MRALLITLAVLALVIAVLFLLARLRARKELTRLARELPGEQERLRRARQIIAQRVA